MDLIIACFTEAPHNPVAAFLALGITFAIVAAVSSFVRGIVRNFTGR